MRHSLRRQQTSIDMENSILTRFPFGRISLFILLALYSVAGGLIFVSIERPAYINRMRLARIRDQVRHRVMTKDFLDFNALCTKLTQYRGNTAGYDRIMDTVDIEIHKLFIIHQLDRNFIDTFNARVAFDQYKNPPSRFKRRVSKRTSWWRRHKKDKNQQQGGHLGYTAQTQMQTTTEEMNITALPRHKHCNTAVYARFIAYIEDALPQIQRPDIEWTFTTSIFYSMTLYTTIGYGNIVCKTYTGKWASVFYALVGIPLALCVLAQIGIAIEYCFRSACDFVAKCYDVLHCCWCCGGLTDVVDPGPGARSTTSESRRRFAALSLPATLLIEIGMLLFYITGFAVYITWSGSGMNFSDAFYFSFVSMSTIGLGDVMPDRSWWVVSIVFVFIGLALVSTAIASVFNKMQSYYEEELEARLMEFRKKGIRVMRGAHEHHDKTEEGNGGAFSDICQGVDHHHDTLPTVDENVKP